MSAPRPPAREQAKALAGSLLTGLCWLAPRRPAARPAAAEPPCTAASPSRLQALIARHPLATWRPLARLVMAAVALFLGWAAFAPLDEVAVATGEVVPEGKVRVIQHLEGGVVREISVQDGAVVTEGAPLMLLELSANSMNRDELQVRLDGLTLLRARLQAEIGGGPLTFPAEEAKRRPQLATAETRNYEARRQALQATIGVLNDQTRQRSLEIQELEARARALSNNLKLARERLAMSTDLLKSGLTARMEHIQLQSQVEDLEGQVESTRASIPRAQAALAETKSRIGEEQARFARTAQGDLADAELNLARTVELLGQASDQQRRTQLTSPVDGIVKNLRANTIGGVVRPGEPIMEIVPLNERLQVDARLSPADRGYVRAGQAATVKLSAYDFTTYGGLDGTVVMVAPDTTLDADNQPYYRVLVQTERAYLGSEDDKHPITAGMQASVEIHTGTRTVLQYLIRPVLKLRHEAFRER